MVSPEGVKKGLFAAALLRPEGVEKVISRLLLNESKNLESLWP